MARPAQPVEPAVSPPPSEAPAPALARDAFAPVFGAGRATDLADIPAGPFRDELARLAPAVRAQVLSTLDRLRIPRQDVAALGVDADGSLYYRCDPRIPAPPHETHGAEVVAADEPTERESPAAAAVAISSPPVRHSRLGASRVIYLDFNGHAITGTRWNNQSGSPGDASYRPAVATYEAQPYDTDGNPGMFSDAEQAAIVETWARVAEDFAAFDVDVTTEEPAAFGATTARALITHSLAAGSVPMPRADMAGVAYLDVFGRADFQQFSPALIYYDKLYGVVESIAEVVSHELGHNLGLSHDGTPTDTYYDGHGSGEITWGAIMGSGYYKHVTQWSKGEYFDSNNPQDDLAIIGGKLGGLPDDHGPGDRSLDLAANAFEAKGILGQGDEDTFALNLPEGDLAVQVQPFRGTGTYHGGNSDLALDLRNAAGAMVASADPAAVKSATLNVTVPAGSYRLTVRAVGVGNPLANPPSGYTAYGSQGAFTLSGSLAIRSAPVIVSQPSPQTVVDGQPAQFTVAATAHPAATYRWQRLPVGSGTWADLSNSYDVSGATSPTLQLSYLSVARTGDQFRCVVTNPLGSATSAAAWLTVNPALPVVTMPSAFSVNYGSWLSISPSIFGTSPFTYRWTRDGQELPDANYSSYYKAAVTSADTGAYVIWVTNAAGTVASAPVQVTVRPPVAAVFRRQPYSQSRYPGQPVTFDAAADGTSPIQYQWFKDGVAISTLSGSNAFTIPAVTESHLGAYTVVLTNPAGSVTSAPAILSFSSFTEVDSIAAGASHGLFVKSDGVLWGMGANWYGQLGHPGVGQGSVVYPTALASGVKSVEPVRGNFSLFIKDDDTLWGAGENSYRALGGADDNPRVAPVLLASEVRAAAGGAGHTLILGKNGVLSAMGANDYGQLGDGTTNRRTAPVAVASDVVAIAAGLYHSLFLKADRTLWGMGHNTSGQVNGTANPQQLVPVLIASDVSQIAGGYYHTLFIKTDGSLWGVGANGSGQLGDGTTTERRSPVKIAEGVAGAWGSNHTIFLKADGTLWGTGANWYGAIGAGGTTSDRTSPLAFASEVVRADAGGQFTYFVRRDGTLWALGNGINGQLGVGDIYSTSVPAQVTYVLASYPAIQFPPVDVAVAAGQYAVFKAGVSGAQLSYRWQYRQAGQAEWADLANGGVFSGATTAELVVDASLAHDGWSFRAIASNFLGSVTTAPATLRVTSAESRPVGLPSVRTELAVVPGIEHLPLRLPLTLPPGLELGQIAVSADASWLLPSVDVYEGELLIGIDYSGPAGPIGFGLVTITGPDGTLATFQVRAKASPLNLTALHDDPWRSRIYGLHQDGSNTGALVAYDPNTGGYVGSVSLGRRPSDLAISADGREMVVLCAASHSIAVVDLVRLVVTETLPLANYGDVGAENSGHIQYGAGNVLYYVDGAWAPVMHVYDRVARSDRQTLLLDGGNVTNSNGYGFGDFVVLPDGGSLVAWGQYGWDSGRAGSEVARLTIAADGTLSAAQTAGLTYPTFRRDPLDTPMLVTADGSRLFAKNAGLPTGALRAPVTWLAAPAYAISPDGEVVSTEAGIYLATTGSRLAAIEPARRVQAITSDYAHLVYFNPTERRLQHLDLRPFAAEMGREVVPADGANVLAPAELRWSAQVTADSYRVYLGTEPDDLALVGEVTGTSIALPTPPAAGRLHYWRVDVVNAFGVSTGAVSRFTPVAVATGLQAIDTATVRGHARHTFEAALGSAEPGEAWSASSSAHWIKLSATSGVTPATLRITLDATLLSPALHESSVIITSGSTSQVIPVRLRVDALAISHLVAAPDSTKVYAVSEENSGWYNPANRAYLLEIDTLFRRIERVVPAGAGVTSLALHAGDARIYLSNAGGAFVRGYDRDTLALERTFALAVENSDSPAYRIAGGPPGRLVVGTAYSSSLRLLDTGTGAVIGQSSRPEGSIAADPSGRYLYHGAGSLAKFDLAGDEFAALGEVPTSSVTGYHARNLLISHDGQRIAYSGAIHGADLGLVWSPGTELIGLSEDGQVAFSSTQVFDVANRRSMGLLPATLERLAFSSATARVVYQSGAQLGFHDVPVPNAPSWFFLPAHGAIGPAPSDLSWGAMPGVTGYRVYLGDSEAAVAAADPADAEYLGEFTGPSAPVPPGLELGHRYFWRVDILVGGEVATGSVRSFFVADLVPGRTRVAADTVAVDPGYRVNLDIGSPVAGRSWSVSADVPWIRFNRASGTTPATVELSLDARGLVPGDHQGTITLTGPGAAAPIPVQLRVDPLALTILKAEPKSPTVFGISEHDGTAPRRAYLLEIDATAESVRRVLPVGSDVTDLALHAADRRIFLPNWRAGRLQERHRDTLALVKEHPFRGFTQIGYGEGDAYRVAAGAAGRIVVEEYDQWIESKHIDYTTGTVLAVAFMREGGGQFEPTGRYYFHGDNNTSDASLRKYDTAGTSFTQVRGRRPEGLINYYGSRNVVMASSGERIFWNGGVFDPDVNLVWQTSEEIFSVSADGRYAFGRTKVHDTVEKRTLGNMPVETTVSAYCDLAGVLVAQSGSGLGFFRAVSLQNALTTAAHNFPARARPAGRPVTFSVTVANTGTKPWGPNHLVALQDGAGTNLAFASVASTFVGGSKTVNFTFTAPAAAGSYAYKVVGLENGVEWFGTAYGFTLQVAEAGARPPPPTDFNGDGFADLIWQNINTGQRAIWLLNGTTPFGSANLIDIPTDWDLVGAADFNLDGSPDLIWQNLVTGERAIWLFSGTTPIGSAPLLTIPVEWDLVGAADFNLDGYPDLIWQNTVTGERAIWLFNGTTPIGSAPLLTIPTEWDLVGAADFNRDGYPDLIWQNLVTGERAIWLFQGTTPIGSAPLLTISTDWDLVGAVDLNGDDYPDLIWQNLVTGQRALWLMNGTVPISSAPLIDIPTEWRLVR